MEYSTVHRKVKSLVQNGGGDWKEYIKKFDVLVGDSPPETTRDLVRIVSKSIDASGAVFDYDKLTKIISTVQLENNQMKAQRMQILEDRLRKLVQTEIAKKKLNESSNPEGDRKIGKFIQTLAVHWDIPQIDAARYVFQYIKRRYGSEF